MAIRMRLILPASNAEVFCPYAGTLGRHTENINLNDNFGHCMRCRPASGVDRFIQSRHNYLRDALEVLLKSCLYGSDPVPQRAIRHEIDVRTCIPNITPGNDLIADIIAITDINDVNSHTYVIDVTVVDPTNKSGIRKRGRAAKEAENEKRIKYNPILGAPNTTFIPFAIECNGYMGYATTGFMNMLIERTHNLHAISNFLYLASSITAKFTALACKAGWETANMVNAPPKRRHPTAI